MKNWTRALLLCLSVVCTGFGSRSAEAKSLDAVEATEATWDRGTFLRVFRPELAWPHPSRPALERATRFVNLQLYPVKGDPPTVSELLR